MPKTSKPRAGSLQYWPRKKAKKIYPNIKAWNRAKDNKLLGFIGYKVGMTHLHYVEQNKKDETFSPVTIVECPPLKPFSLMAFSPSSMMEWVSTTEVVVPSPTLSLVFSAACLIKLSEACEVCFQAVRCFTVSVHQNQKPPAQGW